MLRNSRSVRAGVALVLCFSMVVPPVYASGPSTLPTTIISEGFESLVATSYPTIRPHIDASHPGTWYWGRWTTRKRSGSYGLWAAGSDPTKTTYSRGTAGNARFDLSTLADYFSSQLSFYYTLPSRGSGDANSLSVEWSTTETSKTPDTDSSFPLTGAGAWSNRTYDMSSGAKVPLGRKAGVLDFFFIDFNEAVAPFTGEGPTIDDVSVTGWKYGPVRDLSASTATTTINLGWERPQRAALDTAPEERTLAYRVWRVPAGASEWTELTTTRLGDLVVNYSTPIAGEGVQYRYALQAWDPGTGPGYGRVAETTVTVPLSPPTVTMATPAPDFPVSLVPVTVSGTSADIGTGVRNVQVRVRRADGACWNGLSWVTTDTWINAVTSNNWDDWSYVWQPDEQAIASGQIVTIGARARDGANQLSTVKQVSSAVPMAPSVTLAGGAPVTTDPVVTATISANGVTDMRYSVNGEAYSSWMLLSSTTPVSLGTTDGDKLVTFQFSWDAGTTVAYVASDSIFLHTSYPQVVLSHPSAGFSFMDGTVQVAGTASDEGADVSVVGVRIRRSDGLTWNGADWVTAETWLPVTTADGFATWTYDWTPDESIRQSGQLVTIAARATDAYGLQSTTPSVRSSVLVVASLSLDDGAVFTTETSVTASIAATGSPTEMRYRLGTEPFGPWEAFREQKEVSIGTGDGEKSVTFEIGNGESSVLASDTIVLHTSTPFVALSSPSEGFSLAGTAFIVGNASDAGGTVTSVEVRMRRTDGRSWDGSSWVNADAWLPATATASGFSTWAYAWEIDADTYAAGQVVNVSARASDQYGLTGFATPVQSAVPVKPTLSLADGSPYVSTTTVDASLSAPAASQMRYRVGSGVPGPYSPYSTATTVTIPSVEGSHTVTFDFAADPDRVYASASASVMLDRVAPSVVSEAPASGFLLAPGSYQLAGSAVDSASGLDEVLVRVSRSGMYWNGFGWQDNEHWLLADGTDSWSLPWMPSATDLMSSYDPVTVNVIARDRAGNVSDPVSIVSDDPKEPTSFVSKGFSGTLRRYGQSVSISATLSAQVSGPLAGKPVRLRVYDYYWKKWTTRTGTTSSTGHVAFTAIPANKSNYRIEFLGDAQFGPTTSTIYVITPRARVGNVTAPTTMYRYRTYALWGLMNSRHRAGTYPVRIYRERYVSGRWVRYSGYVKTKANNYNGYSYLDYRSGTKYVAAVKLPYRGRWRLRAYHPADAGHPAVWSSGWRYVTVR